MNWGIDSSSIQIATVILSDLNNSKLILNANINSISDSSTAQIDKDKIAQMDIKELECGSKEQQDEEELNTDQRHDLSQYTFLVNLKKMFLFFVEFIAFVSICFYQIFFPSL